MLNKDNIRELAYVVKINDVKPIDGYDRVELAVVNGWTIVVGKNEFRPGDLAVYFEIDSKLPEVKPFTDMEFLAKKHYKVKTQKMCKSISQGLLISAESFNWKIVSCEDCEAIKDDEGKYHYADGESRFLTKKIGVIYAVADDNVRKAKSDDKYKKMCQRRPDVFKKPWAKWFMHREWGRKLMFMLFGKKKDNHVWPAWVVKTDEERVQNMPWILNDKSEWFATEKIDGTSTTFTMKRGKFGKNDFYICSRNVCFDTPEKMAKGAWYDTNVYQEMAIKYGIEDILKEILDDNKDTVNFITLQGETYGQGIQTRDYHLEEHNFMAFNLIFGYKDGRVERLNPQDMTDWLFDKYGIPCVPIVNKHYILPDTIEELLEFAGGESAVDGDPREGIVFRSYDGARSFKAVDNNFIMKYHG